MRNHEKVIKVEGFLTPAECDDLRSEARLRPNEDGTIYRKIDDEYRQVVDKDARRARQFKVEHNDPLFNDVRNRLHVLGRQVNAEHFDFNLSGHPFDRMIYVHYSDGGFFGPHRDALGDETIGFKKLAMILLLSPTSEFTGGDLIISPHGPQPMEQGDVVIFPTYLIHQVAAVNGDREVLINWCTSGTPFR